MKKVPVGVWKSVDTQKDLEELDGFLWDHDKETVEFYAKSANESYFPADVSRSGYDQKNLHVLVKVGIPVDPPYLEIAFIAYEHIGADYLDSVHARGRLDSLKRVDIDGIKCARLVYRWVDEPTTQRYFRETDSIGSDE